MVLGWTPDKDTLIELRAGKGGGESRYEGRTIGCSRFIRKKPASRFEKSNIL